MKKLYYVAALAILFGGCTIKQPLDHPHGAIMECETEDCVIAEKDKIMLDNPHQWDGERFRFMEGYKPQSLAKMKEEGRLVINKWNPFQTAIFTAIGPAFGAATFHPTIYGDIHDCTVWYSPLPGWQWYLSHELSHCLGYDENGIFYDGIFNDYTQAQKAIMKEEGVSRWIDTRFYREEMSRWYEDDFGFYLADREDMDKISGYYKEMKQEKAEEDYLNGK